MNADKCVWITMYGINTLCMDESVIFIFINFLIVIYCRLPRKPCSTIIIIWVRLLRMAYILLGPVESFEKMTQICRSCEELKFWLGTDWCPLFHLDIVDCLRGRRLGQVDDFFSFRLFKYIFFINCILLYFFHILQNIITLCFLLLYFDYVVIV